MGVAGRIIEAALKRWCEVHHATPQQPQARSFQPHGVAQHTAAAAGAKGWQRDAPDAVAINLHIVAVLAIYFAVARWLRRASPGPW